MPVCTAIDTPVLNPDLFRRIWLAFSGEVKICNPGQPMIINYNSSSSEIEFWGESYHVNCFGCGDRRLRLYISHRFGTEDISGKRLFNLLKCHNEDCQKNPGFVEELLHRLYVLDLRDDILLSSTIENTVEKIERQDIKIPGDVVFIKDNLESVKHCFPEIINYLSRGGQDPYKLAEMFFLGVLVKPLEQYHYLNRGLFIPILSENNEIKGWQVRTFFPRKHFWSSRGIKNNIFCYWPTIKNKKTIVLCEGVSDVMSVAVYDGVALFGKSISYKQMEIINNFPCEKVLILLDGDALEDARKLALQLKLNLNKKIVIGKLPPGMDPSDFTRERLKQWLSQKNLEEV
jgi:hypothetical protein